MVTNRGSSLFVIRPKRAKKAKRAKRKSRGGPVCPPDKVYNVYSKPKRAAGKFNSSAKTGEVPQAEVYMTAITQLYFAMHQTGSFAF